MRLLKLKDSLVSRQETRQCTPGIAAAGITLMTFIATLMVFIALCQFQACTAVIQCALNIKLATQVYIQSICQTFRLQQ